MQLRQSPLPPRQPLRLSDAGDAQSGWIGVLTTEHYNLAMLRGRWQPFQKMLSVAGSVGVLASVVFGADIGVLAYGVGAPLYAVIGTGACAGAVAAVLTGLYQYRHWCEATPASWAPAASASGQAACLPSPVSRGRGKWD